MPSGLIVAHGSPSAPERQEHWLAGLAERVADHLPQWRIASATLAAPGALDVALASFPASEAVFLFPHFMADGWFVTEELPRRLTATGQPAVEILPPLGLDPGLARLCVEQVCDAANAMGLTPPELSLVLPAHGSPSHPRPAAAALMLAATIQARSRFASVRVGFVDQAPFLVDALRVDGPAICLPLFASRAGHVRKDLPEAITAARFQGTVLPPIGIDPACAGLIADALSRAVFERRKPRPIGDPPRAMPCTRVMAVEGL